MYHMGDNCDDIFASFNLSADDAKVYDTVKTRLEEHFVVNRNVIFERAQFNVRKQMEGESAETFIVAL
jgi:hypothetical protein